MHYCFMLFTKEKPKAEDICKILDPYYEETVYENHQFNEELPILIWDWWQIDGRYSHITNDKSPILASEIPEYDSLQTFGCIDVDGTIYARSHYNCKEIVEHPEYWDKLEEIKKRNKDCWVTILDLHD